MNQIHTSYILDILLTSCKFISFLAENIQVLIDEFSLIIGIIIKMLTNGQRHQGSIPGRVIPLTQNLLLDASLLKTKNYYVWIKGK